ncbi:MAG: O-methyltransferase [Acetivibrionales bacterium]|jgi:predicted O-methyltransferase YrrM|nr:O-methyltransferase [Clostridiaceae bacterium]HPZ05944.1 O-methyltransferase [Clostridiales bacterium]HQD30311.1 O-methyltransferase [Clostridiales bacterium]
MFESEQTERSGNDADTCGGKMMKPGKGLLKEMEQYACRHHVPIINRETAELLIVLGRLVRPARILEIGTAIGYSAILLSGILAKGGRIDTIERDEDMLAKAHENIKRAGLEDTIAVIAGDASDVLPCLDKSYDMIFMDAAKGQYIGFLPECLRMLRNGGLLISDNVLYKGMVASGEPVGRKKRTIVNNMREYLDTLRNDPSLDTSILTVGDGVALSYKRLETEMDP